MTNSVQFNRSIPQNYEDYLTPFIFDPYAEDLVERIGIKTGTTSLKNVLELACGTGAVTKQLLARLPSTVQLIATDLQPDMISVAKISVAKISVAKRHLSASNLAWDTVDMTNIPYEDNRFDLIVCQFGLMLVPEKLKALTQMHRVLRPGGRLLSSVWSDIRHNQIWDITGSVIESFIGTNPMLHDPGPFSMADASIGLEGLKKAGFQDAKVTVVDKTGKIATAAMAVKGITEGLPVWLAISQKDPSLPAKVQAALEQELVNRLGDHPFQSSLQALVFETNK
jgi:SAM-dependent methyltransferase